MSERTLKRQMIKDHKDNIDKIKVLAFYLSILIVILYLIYAIYLTKKIWNSGYIFLVWYIFAHLCSLIPFSYHTMNGSLKYTKMYRDVKENKKYLSNFVKNNCGGK